MDTISAAGIGIASSEAPATGLAAEGVHPDSGFPAKAMYGKGPAPAAASPEPASYSLGKPVLPPAEEDAFNLNASDFSDDEIGMTVMVLFGLHSQIRSSTASVGNMSKQEQEISKKNAAKYKERHEKLIQEEKEGGLMKILKIIGQAFAAVGAIIAAAFSCVAAVATGGLAAPLVAAAVVGVMFALEALINVILAGCDKPPISLIGLLTQGFTELVKACGMPEDIAKMIGAGLTVLAATVAMCLCPAAMDAAVQAVTQMAQAVVEKYAEAGLAANLMIAISVCAAVVGMAGSYMGSRNLDKQMQNVQKKIGKEISAAFVKATGKEMSAVKLNQLISDRMKGISLNFQKAGLVAQLSASGTSGIFRTFGGASSLTLAETRSRLAQIKSEVQEAKADAEAISAAIEDLHEWLGDLVKQASSITESCVDRLGQQNETRRRMANNLA